MFNLKYILLLILISLQIITAQKDQKLSDIYEQFNPITLKWDTIWVNKYQRQLNTKGEILVENKINYFQGRIEKYLLKNNYDSKGRLIEKRKIGYFVQRDEQFERWEYDSNDSLTLNESGYYNDSLKHDIVLKRTVKNFNFKNKLIEIKCYEHYSKSVIEPPLVRYVQKFYNTKWQLEKYQELNVKTLLPNYYLTYSYSNNKIQVLFFTPNHSSAVFQDEYFLNSDGKIINYDISSYDFNIGKFNLVYRYNYQYDSQGNQIFYSYSVQTDSLLFLNNYWTKKYDTLNRLKSEKEFYRNYDNSRFVCTQDIEYYYDSQNRISKTVGKSTAFDYSPFDNSIYTTEFTYDIGNRKLLENHSYEYFLGKKLIKTDLLRNRFEYEQTGNLPNELADYVIYPNPATDQINIQNTEINDCLKYVELLNSNGQKIATFNQQSLFYNYCIWQIKIQSSIPKGIYLIKMVAGNEKEIYKKIVIEN